MAVIIAHQVFIVPLHPFLLPVNLLVAMVRAVRLVALTALCARMISAFGHVRSVVHRVKNLWQSRKKLKKRCSVICKEYYEQEVRQRQLKHHSGRDTRVSTDAILMQLSALYLVFLTSSYQARQEASRSTINRRGSVQSHMPRGHSVVSTAPHSYCF